MKNSFALDRAPENRTTDKDGHLHVKESVVSRAEVSPYLGKEIPGCEELGLDPEHIYQLLRDPKELEAGTPSLNGKPLMFIHKPIDSKDHPFEEVVGAVFNPVYDNGEVKAEIVVWPGKASKAIEDETQRDLSCGYEYTPKMTPGTYEGKSYDGVMTGIRFNHCALVEDGRVKGAFVGDAAIKIPKETDMAKIKLPKGATVALFNAIKPKMAQDATLEGFHKLIDSLTQEEKSPAEDDDDKSDIKDAGADIPPANPEADKKKPVAEDDDDVSEKIKAILAGKVDDETLTKLLAICCGGQAQDDDGGKPANQSDGGAVESCAGQSSCPVDGVSADQDKDDKIGKPAMDAALANQEKRIVKRMQDAMEAREFVRPHVGNLPFALDSAESVLRAAAVNLGIPSAKTVHESALRDLISFKVAAKPAQPNRIAQDAAGAKSYAEMFPGADKIGRA